MLNATTLLVHSTAPITMVSKEMVYIVPVTMGQNTMQRAFNEVKKTQFSKTRCFYQYDAFVEFPYTKPQ